MLPYFIVLTTLFQSQSLTKGGNSSNGDRSMNLLAAVFTLRMAGRLESEFGKKGTFQAC